MSTTIRMMWYGAFRLASLSTARRNRRWRSSLQHARTAPMTISGYRIAPAVPDTIALNFDGGSEAIPTFSLADLRACNEKGDGEFFRRYFDGKVVLIATVLDVEDRQVTSKRFATAPENPVGPRCALP